MSWHLYTQYATSLSCDQNYGQSCVSKHLSKKVVLVSGLLFILYIFLMLGNGGILLISCWQIKEVFFLITFEIDRSTKT
jgi:hypothetical protein